MKSTLRHMVEETIRRHGLICSGDHVIVGVSGGADSMALAYLLHFACRRIHFRLTIAHLNHRLRGDESDADEAFVRDVAHMLGLNFIAGFADVAGIAHRHQPGISLEMAARRARHDFFLTTLESTGAHGVALAHTADDQAETTLLRLLRGSGARGLAAMRHRCTVNDIPLIRPLLDVSRASIVAFLQAHGLGWRDDASNRSPVHLRNRVRHELLPLLEHRFNPGVRETLHHTAEILTAEDDWLERCTGRVLELCQDGRALRVEETHRIHPAIQRRVLRRWLSVNGFPGHQHTFATIEQLRHLLASCDGTQQLSLVGGWQAVRRYSLLVLEVPATRHDWPPTLIAVPGTTEIPGSGCKVHVSIAQGFQLHPGPESGEHAYIDADKIDGRTLTARPWQSGDRMRPLGMAGRRKLQDVFTDLKIPRDQRHRLPVFTCGEDILWVPGWRVAADWAVRGSSTPSLHLKVSCD